MDKTPTNKPDEERGTSVVDEKAVEVFEQPVTAVEAESPAETPVPAAEPAVTPNAAVTPVTPHVSSVSPEQPKTGSSAGLIILQWLTYAFWGWTILSLVWLIFIVLANFMTKNDTSGMVPYAIAAALVLLPISIICEIFYSRHEPAKKSGAAMVVMVIHAVIFALFGIGMLITGVLTVVQTAISSSVDNSLQVAIIMTSFISAAIYAFTFLRTLNPFPSKHLSKLYLIVMSAVVAIFIILGFVGPVAQAQLVKNDRLIEQNITTVQESVDRSVSDNKKLPRSLDEIELSGDAKLVVDKQLVSYEIDTDPSSGKVTKDVFSNNRKANNDDEQESTPLEYTYQLCATYQRESPYYSSQYDTPNDTYEEYVSASSHPAGTVCYKLKKIDY